MATVVSLGVTYDTTSGSKSVTCTPQVGDLLVVCTVVTGTGSGGNTFPVADNNNSGIYIQSYDPGGPSSPNARIWVRTTFVTSAVSTVVTATQSSNGGGLEVFAVRGMSKAGRAAVRQSYAASGATGDTPQVDFGQPVAGLKGACLATNTLIGVVGNIWNPAAQTPPSSWTESQDLGYSTPSSGMETCFRESGETASLISWGSWSSTWAAIIVELDTSTLSPVLPVKRPQFYSTRRR